MWDTIKDFFVNLYDSIVTSDYYLWILSGIVLLLIIIIWFVMKKINAKKQ